MTTLTTPLQLGLGDAGRVVSSEEFASAEFAEPWRYERVEGRLVVVSPKSPEHDDSLEPWVEAAIEYKRRNKDIVDKVVTEAWIRVDGDSDRIADLAIYLRSPRAAAKRPDRIPDFIVEIVSDDAASRARDYVEKVAVYQRLGVLQYVVVDRFLRKVTVYRYTERGTSQVELSHNDRFESELLKGFVVDVVSEA